MSQGDASGFVGVALTPPVRPGMSSARRSRRNARTVPGAVASAARRHPLILTVTAAWAVIPFVPLVIVAARIHGTLTGADGTDLFDQAQYLAWIADAGRHGLASDLWQIHGTRHCRAAAGRGRLP